MNIFNKIDRALSKINQPTPLDKIITGIARPIEAGKLEDSLIVELNDRICRKQRSAPKGFYWDIVLIIALCFSAPLIAIFLGTDSILMRIISVIVYIAICIGGGIVLLCLIESLS